MNNRLAALLQVLGIAVLWIALFEFNAWFFGYFEWTKLISWVFLPAAVRLLGVALFSWRGALGLWCGTLVTNIPVFGSDLFQSMQVATVSATGPVVAMLFMLRIPKIPMDFRGLTTAKLTIFALVAAVCNVVICNLYFWITNMASNPFDGLIPMFVGDVAGTVLVLYTLRGMLVASERFVQLPTR